MAALNNARIAGAAGQAGLNVGRQIQRRTGTIGADQGATTTSSVVSLLTTGEDLEFIDTVPSRATTPAIGLTLVGLINSPDTEDHQACAYYLSVLMTTMKDLKDTVKDVMTSLGYNVRYFTEENFAEINFEVGANIQPTHLYVIIGQLIFILYKNINPISYNNFMMKRTKAMKAFVGVNGPLIPGSASEVAISCERAAMIRNVLGAQHQLKKRILEYVLSGAKLSHPIAHMFSYISRILQWSDMSTVMFMFYEFCIKRSPILRDPDIQEEVNALRTALDALQSTQQPEYFRLLNPYNVTHVLERSKFPNLSALAIKLKESRSTTVTQYVRNPLAAGENALVNRLFEAHNNYIATVPDVLDRETARFLYNLDGEGSWDNWGHILRV